jgi:MORN repeat
MYETVAFRVHQDNLGRFSSSESNYIIQTEEADQSHTCSTMSTESKEWLEEENRKLKLEVKQLRDELVERDAFVAVLEAQIKALVKESSGSSSSHGNGPSSASSASKKSPPAGVGVASTFRENGRSATSATKSRTLSDDDDESTRPPTRMHTPSRRPSLDPPRRRTEVSTGESAPTRNERCTDNGADVLESGLPRRNFATLIEEADENVDATDDHDANFFGCAMEEIRTRRSLIKAQGTIKALPRELSIRNAEDDDVTKYSVDDSNMPTYYLEASEMRDAYNARGLYTGCVSRKQQVPHGKGMMNYHLQGRSYEGDWVMGHWHGYGKIRCANGDLYEGSVNNDLREGKCT